MVEEVIIGGAISVGIVGGGYYLYHRFTGNAVEADLDQDGETDLTLEQHDDPSDHTIEDDVAAASDVAVQIGGELSEITGIGESRAEDLIEAGFETAEDIYFANDEELKEIDGIADYTVEQIRDHVGGVGE